MSALSEMENSETVLNISLELILQGRSDLLLEALLRIAVQIWLFRIGTIDLLAHISLRISKYVGIRVPGAPPTTA